MINKLSVVCCMVAVLSLCGACGSAIDHRVQSVVEEELLRMVEYVEADCATAIVMDVETGRIKGAAGFEYNADDIIFVIKTDVGNDSYAPGAVMIPLSMKIALDERFITDRDSVILPSNNVGNRYDDIIMTDMRYMENITADKIIECSSNVGISNVITNGFKGHYGLFAERLRRIGFCGVDSAGIDLKKLANMSYGYRLEVTPLQLLTAYNEVARRHTDVDNIVAEMLLAPVYGDEGTASKWVGGSGVKVAGKSGTVYRVNEETGEYDASHKTLTFCGFFPADDPEYSCIVVIDNPKVNRVGAASTSGCVFRCIADRLAAEPR